MDVADLVGLDQPTGVAATDDVDALLALEPDCVVYAALLFDLDEVERILRAGVNIVTTTQFMTGGWLDPGRPRPHRGRGRGGRRLDVRFGG